MLTCDAFFFVVCVCDMTHAMRGGASRALSTRGPAMREPWTSRRPCVVRHDRESTVFYGRSCTCAGTRRRPIGTVVERRSTVRTSSEVRPTGRRRRSTSSQRTTSGARRGRPTTLPTGGARTATGSSSPAPRRCRRAPSTARITWKFQAIGDQIRTGSRRTGRPARSRCVGARGRRGRARPPARGRARRRTRDAPGRTNGPEGGG